MASQYPPKSYDERTTQALEQALSDVCEILEAHHPDLDWSNDPRAKRNLKLMLMTLADCGVTDPHQLRNRALKNFNLNPLN